MNKGRPVKSDSLLLPAHHRCDISSKGAVLPVDAMTPEMLPVDAMTPEMGLASSLHSLVYYSEYKESFDLTQVC